MVDSCFPSIAFCLSNRALVELFISLPIYISLWFLAVLGPWGVGGALRFLAVLWLGVLRGFLWCYGFGVLGCRFLLMAPRLKFPDNFHVKTFESSHNTSGLDKYLAPNVDANGHEDLVWVEEMDVTHVSKTRLL